MLVNCKLMINVSKKHIKGKKNINEERPNRARCRRKGAARARWATPGALPGRSGRRQGALSAARAQWATPGRAA